MNLLVLHANTNACNTLNPPWKLPGLLLIDVPDGRLLIGQNVDQRTSISAGHALPKLQGIRLSIQRKNRNGDLVGAIVAKVNIFKGCRAFSISRRRKSLLISVANVSLLLRIESTGDKAIGIQECLPQTLCRKIQLRNHGDSAVRLLRHAAHEEIAIAKRRHHGHAHIGTAILRRGFSAGNIALRYSRDVSGEMNLLDLCRWELNAARSNHLPNQLWRCRLREDANLQVHALFSL